MDLNSIIDHTNLKPVLTRTDLVSLCREAKKFKFWSVCVNPVWAKEASRQGVRVCAVVGFPLGANTLAIKIAEAKQAMADGADELDIVVQFNDLTDQLRPLRLAAKNRILKIIIETGYLTQKEKLLAAKLVKQSGADFVKTSTGFGPGGATAADVRLLRRAVGPDFGVKASGGIKTKEQAEAMVRAGANRLGTSSGVAICG